MVYLVANSLEDEQAIQNLSRSDIRPLNIGIVDPTSTINAIERFKQILTHPQHAFPGATAHHVSLAGVLIIPDMSYPSGPVETVAPDLWWDALNVRVLGSVTTVQAFLQTICDFDARLLILTPSIIPSLSPPFHSVESAIVAALNAFSRSLSAELDPLGVAVCQLKLGTFDCGGVGGRQHLQPGNATRADVLSWPSSARAAYAKNYIAQSISAGNRGCVGLQSNGVRGSQLRALHNSVFDAMTVQRPRKVWHVGSGSLMYDTVGRWVPSGLITWMLGIRKVSRNELRDLEPADWGTVERMA
ncbi:MAG: hypothetical protein M1833_005911 [Piccolia ochrophora]|nr:MAG: hypothetical protein M1833_005911 [Piccolia ochrophora]